MTKLKHPHLTSEAWRLARDRRAERHQGACVGNNEAIRVTP